MGTNTKTRQGRCLFLPKEDDIMRTKNISLLLALTLLLSAALMLLEQGREDVFIPGG